MIELESGKREGRKEGNYGISILAGWLALAADAACLVCLHRQVGRYTPVRERDTSGPTLELYKRVGGYSAIRK